MTLDVAWKYCWRRWMIGTEREKKREPGKSWLSARLNDVDYDFLVIPWVHKNAP